MLYIITFVNILLFYANNNFTTNSKNTAISSQPHFRNILKQNYLGHIKKGHFINVLFFKS